MTQSIYLLTKCRKNKEAKEHKVPGQKLLFPIKKHVTNNLIKNLVIIAKKK